jgi:hypothetical protein
MGDYESAVGQHQVTGEHFNEPPDLFMKGFRFLEQLGNAGCKTTFRAEVETSEATGQFPVMVPRNAKRGSFPYRPHDKPQHPGYIGTPVH